MEIMLAFVTCFERASTLKSPIIYDVAPEFPTIKVRS